MNAYALPAIDSARSYRITYAARQFNTMINFGTWATPLVLVIPRALIRYTRVITENVTAIVNTSLLQRGTFPRMGK
ncbi:hypothetical protein BOTBODRAFT_501028 [Botryobasidium botryosum FD-172 SS1]|uniref:Uncharacterized protein n=1 Tax=Botryobasidium botryosum (strain FD-172 SS1) TaxID=930990 RepID=A0A067M5U7_BOTB1|nr:hypothetical protein BOTBODRAFT_501028 [Botryobasidium botryosum FD-172 SS1]